MNIRRTPLHLAIALSVPLTSACAPLSSQRLAALWPWHATPPAAEVAVRELEVTVPADAPMPIVLQYWHRNALLIDLQGVASSGSLLLKPRSGASWPVRLEFRLHPGRFPVLELRGAQRQLYPVAAAGGPVVIAVDPALHPPEATQILVSWGGPVT